EKSPDARVLVLCYNRALSEHLGGQLADHPCRRRIEVSTYHAWASRRTGMRKADDEDFDAYTERVTAHLLEAAKAWPDERRYDAVLVDEAHDFHPDWFRCCVQAVKGGEAGDLLVAVDGAQSLYRRPRKFTWKSVGVQTQGRSRKLSTNYRNTLEILDFAWNV